MLTGQEMRDLIEWSKTQVKTQDALTGRHAVRVYTLDGIKDGEADFDGTAFIRANMTRRWTSPAYRGPPSGASPVLRFNRRSALTRDRTYTLVILPRNPPITRNPEFNPIQTRLCPRPLALGKALTWPIGARHSATMVLSIDSALLSKDSVSYRKIGLTQLLTPRIVSKDTCAQILTLFTESMESQFVLTFCKMHVWPIRFGFQNQWNLNSIRLSRINAPPIRFTIQNPASRQSTGPAPQIASARNAESPQAPPSDQPCQHRQSSWHQSASAAPLR